MGLDLTSALPYVEEQLLKDFSKNGMQGNARVKHENQVKPAGRLQSYRLWAPDPVINGVMEPL